MQDACSTLRGMNFTIWQGHAAAKGEGVEKRVAGWLGGWEAAAAAAVGWAGGQGRGREQNPFKFID